MHKIFRNIAISLRDRLSTPLPLWEGLGVGLLFLALSLTSCKDDGLNSPNSRLRMPVVDPPRLQCQQLIPAFFDLSSLMRFKFI